MLLALLEASSVQSSVGLSFDTVSMVQTVQIVAVVFKSGGCCVQIPPHTLSSGDCVGRVNDSFEALAICVVDFNLINQFVVVPLSVQLVVVGINQQAFAMLETTGEFT